MISIPETRLRAYLPVLILSVVTLGLWLAGPVTLRSLFNQPYTALGKLNGFLAFVFISWNLVLATRGSWIERLHGGLDKVYLQHVFSGKMAFAMMLAHPSLFIISILPAWEYALTYLVPGKITAYNYGILAVYTFTLLIVFSITKFLPYHIWKFTHHFMGVPYILVGLHILNVGSDVGRFLPLKVWMMVLFGVGVASYVYKLALYRFWAPQIKARVKRIAIKDAVAEMYFEPVGRKLSFLPGQFVFLKLKNAPIGGEEHPFTVSSAPGDEMVRISAKASGDYTNRLKEVAAGTEVVLYGPYGSFGVPFLKTTADCTFVAGGIGVTPFLSMLQHAVQMKDSRKFRVFYTVRDKAEAVYENELRSLIDKLPNAELEVVLTSEQGRLSGKDIVKEGDSVKGANFFLCGPPPMILALKEQLHKEGVPGSSIRYELFNFR